MKQSLSESDIATGVEKLARLIRESNQGGDFALVGVRSRGDEVAERVLELLAKDGLEIPMGIVDISLYRDDLAHLSANPKLQGTELPFSIDGAHIILVDDVMFTGRTTRAAIDAVMDYGRPSKLELAVLIDRGHREFPFTPNYVAISLETERLDYVDVKLLKTDGEDSVEVTKST